MFAVYGPLKLHEFQWVIKEIKDFGTSLQCSLSSESKGNV